MSQTNNIPVRITFKGWENIGRVTPIGVEKDFCRKVYNNVCDCVFAPCDVGQPCDTWENDRLCHKKVFVKYEGKF